MNSAHASTPSTATAHAADAVCAIGQGNHLFTGSGSEGTTFWNGTLIAEDQILTCLHAFPTSLHSAGYHELTTGNSANARVARFRRLTNGTVVGGGLCVGYHEVAITAILVPPDVDDICIAYLASDVTHIDPIDIDAGTPAVGNSVALVGWGLDGASVGVGSYPNDARMIDPDGPSPRTVASVDTDAYGLVAALYHSGVSPGPNLYDSGGAFIRIVGSTWKLAGVITWVSRAVAVEQYKHTEEFQLPGLYTPGAADPPTPAEWSQSNDTYIDSANATADNSASEGLIAAAEAGKSTYDQKIIFAGFDLSGVSGDITRVQLVLAAAPVTLPGSFRFRRIRRTGVTHLANWNTYDGTNNWGTAGANNTTSDVYTANQFTKTVSAGGTETIIDSEDHAGLLAMATDAIAEDGILRLLIESTLTDGSGIGPPSLEAVQMAQRPRLIVTSEGVGGPYYEDAGGGWFAREVSGDGGPA